MHAAVYGIWNMEWKLKSKRNRRVKKTEMSDAAREEEEDERIEKMDGLG